MTTQTPGQFITAEVAEQPAVLDSTTFSLAT